MRSTARLIPALLIGAFTCITFIACEKKNNSDQPSANALTDERVTGKWEVVAYHITDYREDTLYNISEYIKDIGQIENGVRVQGWIPQYHVTYLTMQSDHSFFHTDMDGNFDGHMLAQFLPNQNGKWTLKNQSQIELTTLSFADGTPKPMTWNANGYDGHYVNLQAVDSYTVSGAKATTLVLLELERQ